MAPYRGSPAEQPEERLRRHSPRSAHRDHRGLGLGQVVPRVRHPVRGRPVALHRVALHVRPHVPRASRPARRGPYRAHPARHRARAEEPGAHRAVHRRHRHRAARLPPAPLRQDRPRPLPDLRGPGPERLGRPGGRRPAAGSPGRAGHDLLSPARGRRPRSARALRHPAPARLRAGQGGRSGAGPGRGAGPPRCAAGGPRSGPAGGGAGPGRGRARQPATHHRLARDRSGRGRGPRLGGPARAGRGAGQPRLPLPGVRGGPEPPPAAALLVQPPARRLPGVQGLRQRAALRRGPGGAGSDPEPRRRRGRAVVASLRPLVPEAAAEGGQEAGRGHDRAVRGAARGGSPLGLRRRGRAHRDPRLLRGGRVLPLQAARPRLPLALPQPVALPALRGPATPPGGPRGAGGRREHRRVRREDRRGARRALRDAVAHRVGGDGGAGRAQAAARQALVPAPGRPRLPHPRAPDPDPVGRRGPADQSRQPARRPAHRHALRARRAVHRAAPAGHRPAGRALPRARRRRQHGGDGRARPRPHRGGRLPDRDGSRLGRARRQRGLRGHPGRVPQGSTLADRALPERPRHDSPAPQPAAGAPGPGAGGRAREQPEERHREDPAQHAHLCDRGLGLREVHARARHALSRGGAPLQGGLRGARAPTTSCAGCSTSRASASSTRSPSDAPPAPTRSPT